MSLKNNLKTVSIVIPCYNEKEYIIRCLDSIAKQSYPKEYITVFICDGNSTDGTLDLLKAYVLKNHSFILLINTEKTTPHALNLGIKNSTSDVVIILGAHSEIDKDFVKQGMEAFSVDPSIMCVGGLLENVYENETSKTIGLAMSSVFGVGNAHFRTGTKKGYVDTVAFGAYKKEIFEKVGLFNEELIRNQDDEFNYRVTSSGFKIYLTPEVKCKYFVRASFLKLFKQYYQYGYWKMYVNVLHKTVTTVRQLVPAAFVIYLFVLLLLAAINPFLFLIATSVFALYLTIAIIFAFGQDSNPVTAVKIVYAFIILHFSYGVGYIQGIMDFLVFGRKIKKAESLSR